MDFAAAMSFIVNVVLISAIIFLVKERMGLKREMATMLNALNPSKKTGGSDPPEDIIKEIGAIRLQNQRLEAIVAATPFPMLLTDPAGKIVSANQAGMNLLEIEGKKPSDFFGQSVSAFFYNEPDRPSVTDKVIQTRASIRGIEATLKTRKNKTIHVIVDSGPIIAPSGELLGAFSIAVDVIAACGVHGGISEYHEGNSETGDLQRRNRQRHPGVHGKTDPFLQGFRRHVDTRDQQCGNLRKKPHPD